MNYTLLFGILLILFSLYAYYDKIITFKFSNAVKYLHGYKEQLFESQWFNYKIKSNTLFSNYYQDKETYQNIKEQSLILNKYINYL